MPMCLPDSSRTRRNGAPGFRASPAFAPAIGRACGDGRRVFRRLSSGFDGDVGDADAETPGDADDRGPCGVRCAALDAGVGADADLCLEGDDFLAPVALFAKLADRVRECRVGGLLGWHDSNLPATSGLRLDGRPLVPCHPLRPPALEAVTLEESKTSLVNWGGLNKDSLMGSGFCSELQQAHNSFTRIGDVSIAKRRAAVDGCGVGLDALGDLGRVLNDGLQAPSRKASVSVVLGRFDPLLGRGLVDVLREDPAVRLVGVGLQCVELACVLAGRTASTAIVDELAGPSLRMAVRLIQPPVGIVVLVREPPFPCGMVLLEAEMSCLAVNARAEDVLPAVPLTAQGGCMFVSATGERVA